MMIERKIILREDDHWRLAPGADNSAVGVPETLQGLILTRFDRLTPSQRRLLQTASVVGYQFSSQVLNQVLLAQFDGISYSEINESLSLLADREFIIPHPGIEVSSSGVGSAEQSYQFKHVLVSDAVYSTLLQRDRRELHTRVGEAIERIYTDRLDGYIEVLASHFLRSPYLNRALHYLILSGQKAARSYANEQALQLYRQALELLPNTEHTAEQAMKVHFGMGDSLLTAGDYSVARDHYIQAMEAIGVPGRTGALRNLSEIPEEGGMNGTERIRLLSQLQRRIGKTLESQGDYDRALVYLQSAQLVLRYDSGAFALEQASSLNDIGWIFFRRGSLDQAEELLKEGLVIAERAGQLDVTASILNRLAGIYYQRDSVEQASAFLLRSMHLREEIGDVVAVARSYNNLGLLSWKQGLLQEALQNFNRSFRLQANLGDVEGQIVLHTNMGLIEMDCGNLLEAQKHFQEALETAEQIGHFYHVCMARMHLA
ncbi:MAG: tetratricopeptide repeat protein, partial [Anaerolineaceae bacterium]|nr:tetratricopeptide repeat protein [Anaerolineaceae bacterium]